MAKNRVVSAVHRQVKAALEQTGLAPEGSLVVAVSGGPDSLALLHSLHQLREPLGLRLHGAHLDHGLRGDASVGDAEFVADAFRRLEIPFTHEQADVNSFRRERRLSLEQAAREVRYAFLTKVAAEERADAVALGHTADDQAETVLMNIVRGAGLTGLRGMQAASSFVSNGQETVLVRPLLLISKEETTGYCRAMGLQPRLDESNLSLEPKRNRVRLQLLPILEEYNPAVRDALTRLSHSAAKHLVYIDDQVDSVWPEVAQVHDGTVTLDVRAFSGLPPAIQGHLLRRAVSAVKADLQDIQQNHIDAMARLMDGPAGRSLDLPAGLRLSIGYGEATLAPSNLDQCPLPPLEGEHTLKVPGENMLPGWRVMAKLVQEAREPLEVDAGGSAPPDSLSRKAVVDYGSLGGELVVRPRRPGDRFQPLGMSKPKKLQDFMVDSKIPRVWRDRVPLVVSPRGIAWVVGWRIAEWARIGTGESERLELEFEPTRPL